jgi:hypothetical protein
MLKRRTAASFQAGTITATRGMETTSTWSSS